MRDRLGDGYTEALRKVYPDVPDTVDFVMYWWHKAAELVSSKRLERFGFITTNSICQIRQRTAMDFYLNHKNPIKLIFAIPDHPWTDEGAAVRISMTIAASDISNAPKLVHVVKEYDAELPEDAAEHIELRVQTVGCIFSNLQSGVDLSRAINLRSNFNLCSRGFELGGRGFIVDPIAAEKWILSQPLLGDYVRPYISGRDIVTRWEKEYVIDFYELSEEQAINLGEPFQYLLEKVKPVRAINQEKSRQEKWWLFRRSGGLIRAALQGLNRFIVTVHTAKHRAFIFLDKSVIPDATIVVFALDDSYYLGILSSSVHVIWTLASGGTLEDRPRYNQTRCFNPFPFPDATLEQKEKIRQLGERLDRHRKQVQAEHPEVTITGMYNLLEKLRKGEDFTDKDREYNNKALVSTLKQIHDELDNAVLEAYGWEDLISSSPSSQLGVRDLSSPPSQGGVRGGSLPQSEELYPPQSPLERGEAIDLSSPPSQGGVRGGFDITEIILDRLVTLNAQRAEEERNGHIRWLRPEYQAPNEVRTQTIIEGVGESEEVAIAPAEVKTFPKQPKDQLAAIRDLLRTSNNPWTIAQIAAQFKNGGRYKNAISENLERLEWFGILHCHQEAQIKYWQHIETQQAS
ncbi:MAG: type IIL restriction-modification enzyme MmeI, partial [Pseudanabaena sp.]